MKKLLLVLSLFVLISSMFVFVEPVVVLANPPSQSSASSTGRGGYNPDMVEACDIRVRFTLQGREIQQGCYGPSCPGVTAGTQDDWGMVCLLGTIHHVTNWIFYMIMIVVMVMILAGAFMFLTSSGDTAKTSRATKTITFAVIGMVIALLARAIPAAVRFMTGL